MAVRKGFRPRGIAVSDRPHSGPPSGSGDVAERSLCLVAGLALGLLLAAAHASAIVYLIPTDEGLVDRSPVIVYGKVGAWRAGPPAERFPTTDFAFSVEKVLKGEVALGANGAITVRQPGGVTPEGLTTRIMGLPRLVGGDRMLLFLESGPGAYRTVSYGIGMFVEVAAPGGGLLLRDAAGPPRTGFDRVPLRAGRPAAALPRNAERFRRWVLDRAAGGVRAPDYFVEVPSDDLAAAVSRYNLLTPSYCGEEGALERWTEFDSGGSVNIVVQADGLPGIPNGGLAGVRQGISAWNNHPDTNVQLTMSLSNLAGDQLDLEGQDFHNPFNTMVFEDPFDSEEGDFPDESNALGWATISIPCEAAFNGGPKDEEILHTVPHHPERANAYPIWQVSITTEGGFARWLADKENPDLYIAELITHEVGHMLGIDHSCAPDPSSWTVENFEAIMRPWAHHDDRGAKLSVDDRKAVRELYANGPWVRGSESPPRLPGPEVPGEEEPPPTFDPGPPPRTIPGPDACQAGSRTLCLGDDFAVGAHWATSSVDGWQPSGAVRLNEDTGWFWFFGPENVEVVVKVLDGCKINGHRWVFAAGLTDVAVNVEVTEFSTGRQRRYRKRDVTDLMPTVRDTAAFPCEPLAAVSIEAGASSSRPPIVAAGAAEYALSTAAGPAAANGGGPVFLINDRYEVTGEWRTSDRRGAILGSPITRDTMGFHFFNADNTEIVVKVLDGCEKNGYIWVWIAGLTDVGTELAVRDRVTGASTIYETANGAPYGSIRNLRAFRCLAP